jgi:hypothetical protein
MIEAFETVGRDILEVIPCHLLGGAEKNNGKYESG